MDPSAWLEFPSGECISLTGICTLGRGPENRVVIASERVSRRHAVVRPNPDGNYCVMDMGSSNGTFLNGQRLTHSAVLHDGSIIEVGSQKMIFRTPPSVSPALEVADESGVECWLLVVAAVQRGCRTPSTELADKTFESWTERCHRVIGKNQGRTMRGLDDSLLAFWAVEGVDTKADTVVGALRSLRAVQMQTEEFRFALHFGPARLRRSAAGQDAPGGPEVIHALQLDRVASVLNCPVLVTEAAHARLPESLPTRRLSMEELRGYRGELRFFTPAS